MPTGTKSPINPLTGRVYQKMKPGMKKGQKTKKTLLKEEARKMLEEKAMGALDRLFEKEVIEADTNWKVRHWLLEQLIGRAPINLDHKVAGAIDIVLTPFGKAPNKDSLPVRATPVSDGSAEGVRRGD